MKPAIVFTAWLGAASVAAAETVSAEICRRGADERRIEIAAPGTVGASCDVVYIRDGGANVTIPYNANVDRDFCRARAAEMAADLMAEGFDCSTTSTAELEAALAGGANQPPSQGASSAVAAAPASDAAPIVEPSSVPTPEAPQASTPSQVAAVAPDVAPDLPLNEQLEMLEQPLAVATADPLLAPEAANGAPIQLASEARAIEYHAPRPSRTTGAGRLVGPPPSLEGIVDEAAIVAAPNEETRIAAVTPAIAPTSARPAEDVVKGVLAATVAGWNEGNLSVYLGGYADTPEVTVVRNSAAITGVSSVRRHFEEEIATAGGMGRLAFESLDVTMETNDVAAIAGRYSVTIDDKAMIGAMTLVMKHIEGRWRIVSDTRVTDAPPPPLKN